ncbi:MAG: NUDIX domain-containing protein [bacterium]|nr:NUDIX domain-containing protein [bacterium]
MKEYKGFAPNEIFDLILEWAVIPTFDLIIEYGDEGVILVKRKIAPYKNQWALPGLRMLKGESIDATLTRIAQQEVGLNINPKDKIMLSQFVGKFNTENNRQDLSTGYLIKVSDGNPIVLNKNHFSAYSVIKQIPTSNIGAMYKYYLELYKK